MITQPHALNAPGAVEAWRLFLPNLLAVEGICFILRFIITDTDSLNEADVARYIIVALIRAIRKSVYDVANTIFPSNSQFHTGNLEPFFEHYQRVYERGQRLRYPTAWGVWLSPPDFFRAGSGKNRL